MSARWPLAQGGRVGRAGESSAFCPPTQPCRKLVVFMSWGEVRGAHLLSGAEARRSSPVEKKRKTARHEPRTQARETQEAMNVLQRQVKGTQDAVGQHARTGAMIGLKPDGVITGRLGRKLSESDRWIVEGRSDLRGAPWDLRPAGNLDQKYWSKHNLQQQRQNSRRE